MALYLDLKYELDGNNYVCGVLCGFQKGWGNKLGILLYKSKDFLSFVISWVV